MHEALFTTTRAVLVVLLALLLFLVVLALYRRGAKLNHRRVCFVHPDLGIGGAERLVVDAALAMQRLGHEVELYTAHHDHTRCFEETRDGTLTVHVAGAFLPRTVYGRLHVACATLRVLWCAIVLLVREGRGCSTVVVDQVAAPVPLLRFLGMRVVFYCHHPDKLLAPKTGGSGMRTLGRRMYRLPFDLLEEVCTGCASVVLLNSQFTRSVYQSAFPLLHALRSWLPATAVLYPAIDVSANAALPWPPARTSAAQGPGKVAPGKVLLVSLNRFERKKELELAVLALQELQRTQPRQAAAIQLVLAGGWDSRLEENLSYFAELQAMVAAAGLGGNVEFLQNISNDKRRALFQECAALVYTPTGEHFGIVPLEAMAAARPVIAVDSGGPRETVVHDVTGWLCEPTPAAFAAAFSKVVRLAQDGNTLPKVGAVARKHVEDNFSREAFGVLLQSHCFGRTVESSSTKR